MKKFVRIFSVENFFCQKLFCCNIISSETVWKKKNIGRNIFWSNILLSRNFFVAISFPRKQFGWKKFWSKNFLVENFFCSKIISSETVWMKKFWSKNFLGRKCFCCNIISSETISMKKFWSKIFLLNSFPRKQFGWKKICSKIFWSKFFFWPRITLFQNHFLGNSLD